MVRPPYIPDDPEIAVVETAQGLFSYRRRREESMVLLPRPITGCFNDLGIWLLHQCPWRDTRVADGTRYVSVAYNLNRLAEFAKDHSMVWHDELTLIQNDMLVMQNNTGEQAELRVVRDEGYHPETYIFHQDGGNYKPVLDDTDRLMCCYNGPVTECLLSSQAEAFMPTIQGGHNFYQKEGAQPFSPGIGDMWRQACLDGGRALIHRAVEIKPNSSKRLWEGPRPWNPPRLLTVC